MFFGCTFVAFGPAFALFLITVAGDPLRVIIRVAGWVRGLGRRGRTPEREIRKGLEELGRGWEPELGEDKSEVKIEEGRVRGLGDLPFPAVGFRLPGIAEIPPILLPATSEEAQGQDS